jgi:tetratricopeptide (TPR) repeat protein/predicted Ser/Thr protein kinase
MTLPVGTRLGRYTVSSLLGTGGMGEVYLAQDTSLRRLVAIKLLPGEFTRDDARLGRFQREAQAASGLNHPNILTIHEIGEHEGHHFIATEYIEGESLRQHLARTRMEIREALDVAQQVAAALAAAHDAGIVHRDIKPENIMIRRDGLAKVLDFGLAKLAQDREPAATPAAQGTEGFTVPRAAETEPGTIMGTASYMSPEQARGLPVDARIDTWSMGVVLYEMIAGRRPFEGATKTDILAVILHREPSSLLLFRSDAPAELERIVEKALAKEREERYHSAKDLAVDLKRLRHRLDMDAERERGVTPDAETRRASGGLAAASGVAPVASAAAAVVAQGTADAHAVVRDARAESLVTAITRHKLGVGLLVAALVLAIAAALFFSSRRPAALTDRDTILLADFVNTTGDAVFDGTLKQGLAVQLGQSPFLAIFPDARVRQSLRLMGRSPDDRVTKEVAQEICQRQGLKAFLAGSISNLGTSYVVSLEAINGQNGDEIARTQEAAATKEDVLKALSASAIKMREQLGESLSSIQRFDVRLELTTSSLEALKVYSLGSAQSTSGRFLEAIPFFRRAVELDPNFAYAYAALAVQYGNTLQPGLAAEYAEKAFALRNRVSELEKLRIAHFYYNFVTGEMDKRLETLELYKQTYPRDYRATASLSDAYLKTGQFGKAADGARESMRLNPNAAVAYFNLGEAFTRSSRFAEAREVYERALQQKLDVTDVHTGLYRIAFASGDTALMTQQLDWARGKPDEYVASDLQAQTAAFAGQYGRSQEFARRAIDLATRGGAKEVAAQYAAEAAVRGAAFGHCQQAKTQSVQALSLERNMVSLSRGGIAFALCGEGGQAQSVVDELTKRYPLNTLIKDLWLPAIGAATALQRNAAAEAIQLLEAARRYEGGAEFWPSYLRGQAYLRQKAGREAATEFRKIIDNRGQAPLSPLYPLAQLGLARASALAGDNAGARTAYQNFLALWKDADADIAVRQEAQHEYQKLE